MSDERPEALLKSALEKIIYFEARTEQLANDAGAARDETARLKVELSAMAQRELSLRRELAERDVQLSRARRDADESSRLLGALRSERAQLIGKLLEASRIHTDGTDAELPFDLADFIAQLRSEVISHGESQARIPSLPRVTAESEPSVSHGERLKAEGRLDVSSGQLATLSGDSTAPLADETLFGYSVRELAALDAATRIRAAQRLKAIANPAAGSALATALHAETDPSVTVELLGAFCSVAKDEGASVVVESLQSPSADVRIAALKGLLGLDSARAAPHLAAALKDPDRSVRRRAALLSLGLRGDPALELGEESSADPDPDVRSVGVRALAAAGGARAKTRLLQVLKDPDSRVREAAAQGLSRMLGQDVCRVVSLNDAQRRREIRRLSAVTPAPVTQPAARVAAVPARAVARVAVVEVPARPAPPTVSESLCAAVLGEVRCAIRGRTLADLVNTSGQSEPNVTDACELLVARGALVRRGPKFFMA